MICTGERVAGKMISGKFELPFVVVIGCGDEGAEVIIGAVGGGLLAPKLDVVGEDPDGGDSSNRSIEDLRLGQGSFACLRENNGVSDPFKKGFNRKGRVKREV